MFTRFNSPLSHDYFRDKIENKKILIVCSGPSVQFRKWQNLDVDGVITMSFFYNREDLINRKDIIFTSFSNLVDLSNPTLNKFLDNNPQTAVGFEKNGHSFYDTYKYKNFSKKYKDRLVDYYTEIHDKILYIGVGGRLFYFALNYSPSELYYVGFDGSSPKWQNDPDNSFRFGYRPEFIKGGSGSKNYECVYKAHQRVTEDMSKIANERNIKIQNLGEGLPFNCSTESSSKYYPLTQEIKQIIC